MTRKSVGSVDTPLVTADHPPLSGKPIRVSKLKDARRLLARLITQFQSGEVDSRWAKDLCYLVVSFVSVAKDSEIEERLERLEEHLAKTREG